MRRVTNGKVSFELRHLTRQKRTRETRNVLDGESGGFESSDVRGESSSRERSDVVVFLRREEREGDASGSAKRRGRHTWRLEPTGRSR